MKKKSKDLKCIPKDNWCLVKEKDKHFDSAVKDLHRVIDRNEKLVSEINKIINKLGCSVDRINDSSYDCALALDRLSAL